MSWGWMPNFRSFRIISRSEAVPRFRSVDSAMILLLRRLCQTLRIIVDTNASEKIIIGESCDVITKCEIMFHKYSKKSSNRVLKAIFSHMEVRGGYSSATIERRQKPRGEQEVMEWALNQRFRE